MTDTGRSEQLESMMELYGDDIEWIPFPDLSFLPANTLYLWYYAVMVIIAPANSAVNSILPPAGASGVIDNSRVRNYNFR